MKTETINKIVDNDFVVKAYKTDDDKFLKLETEKGLIFTIWEHTRDKGNYQVTVPILPNTETGSSLSFLGDSWHGVELETAIEAMEGIKNVPYTHLTPNQKESVKLFAGIEKAVEHHGNILGFTKIK